MLASLNQVIVNILADTLILSLLALGMGLRVRSAQVYDFSYFAMFALGAYLAWSIASLTGIGLVAACMVSLLCAAVIALLMDTLVLRHPLKRRRHLEAMIASLGIFVVIENAISLIAGPDTKILDQAPSTVYVLDWIVGSPIVNSRQLVAIAISIVVMVILTLFISTSRWGLRFRATDDNRELALALGLRPWRLVSETQLLCAALAALSGLLFALDRDLTPDMAIRPMLHVTVAIVLGGLGTLLGPVAGLLAVTATWHLTGLFFATQWQDISVFVVLLVILSVTPRGLSGSLTGSLRNA